MKTTWFYSILCITILSVVSCSKDELIPEITFPIGTTDYFKSSVDFDNNSNEQIVSFTSNIPWTASLDETRDGSTWCTVSPTHGEAGNASITISVKENTTYDDRNATIRLVYGDSVKNIFVNQKQLDALTLTSNCFEVPATGGTVTVEVKSNIDYQVNIPEESKEWIHQKNTPATRALVISTLTFTVDPSEEYSKREGQIEIISGEKKEIITIYQAGEGILTLTKKVFNLSSVEQDIAIKVRSNFEYSIDFPQVDWIAENNTKTRGASTHTINLHVKENTSYENRSATIRIYDRNSHIFEDVIINQSQNNALLIDKKEFSFDENGGTFTVNINSNIDYKVNISDNWIVKESMVTTRALVKNSHSFKVAKMTGNTPRQAKITFSDKNTGITDEIIIKQNSKFYFKKNNFELAVGEKIKLDLYNNTGIGASWKSSDESVATVDNKGNIKAIARGSVTITASTSDGKHKSECIVTTKDITDCINVYSGGGAIMSNNNLILYGSSLNWYFENKSNSTVTLKSLQLIDGKSGKAGNEMSVDKKVAAGGNIGYSISVGLAGIYRPVTCKYKYEYNGKTYIATAIQNW